jgi:acetyltransferase-like isoleucine patch superfamily enzyme
MYIIIFIKIAFGNFKNIISKLRNRVNNTISNPTCKFYKDSILIDSQLEGYNILFEEAQLFSTKLGKHTYIQKHATIVNAEIGRFCSIAKNVSIGPGIHKIDGVSTHPAFFLKNTPLLKTFTEKDLFNPSKKTVIGNDVWIGENVIIIDGVTIGTGSIIAAGAVVTSDVEPYSIVGGIPAKLIRYRFEKEISQKLIYSKWWELNESEFVNNIILFNSVDKFISNHEFFVN